MAQVRRQLTVEYFFVLDVPEIDRVRLPVTGFLFSAIFRPGIVVYKHPQKLVVVIGLSIGFKLMVEGVDYRHFSPLEGNRVIALLQHWLQELFELLWGKRIGLYVFEE